MENIYHTFEAAGLGKAPFNFVGCKSYAADAADGMRNIGNGMQTKEGTGCAYCGNYIIDAYEIVSADGKRFVVGSECVKKTSDAGLQNKVKQAAAKVQTAKRHVKEDQKIAALLLEFLAGAELLKTKPSPNAWRASEGDTLFDHYVFILNSCGNSGKIKHLTAAVKIIKEISK